MTIFVGFGNVQAKRANIISRSAEELQFNWSETLGVSCVAFVARCVSRLPLNVYGLPDPKDDTLGKFGWEGVVKRYR